MPPLGTTSTSVAVSTTTTLTFPATTTTTLPNFHGVYRFEGAFIGKTCESFYIFSPEVRIEWLGIINGARGDWLDGYLFGTNAEGVRQVPPWWMESDYDCIDDAFTVCPRALLTVHGWPQPTPETAPPAATLVYEVLLQPAMTTCTITYEGTLTREFPDG